MYLFDVVLSIYINTILCLFNRNLHFDVILSEDVVFPFYIYLLVVVL